MNGEDKDQAAGTWHELVFYANKFISSNSEKHLDYMIGHKTKWIVAKAFVFVLLALLSIVPQGFFSVSNWRQWPIFAILWLLGGICASEQPLHFAKEKYKRFVVRNFNYRFNERTQATFDDDVAKKELVEHMNAATNGIECVGQPYWSTSRRIYYKNKILEQLGLVELVLSIVAWTIGIIFCIRLGVLL